MKTLKIISSLALCLGFSARANIIQIGTGLNASDQFISPGDTEQHYSVSGPSSSSSVAYYETAYPGAWVPNVTSGPALGQWISPFDTTTGNPSQQTGTFTYTLTIDGMGSMSGEFASDNPGELFVNGAAVAHTPGWPVTDDQDYHAFTTFNDVLLNQAVNTIQFEVNNVLYSGLNPTGLIVAGTATGLDVSIPDGGMTVAMLGMALGTCGVFFCRMKKLA